MQTVIFALEFMLSTENFSRVLGYFYMVLVDSLVIVNMVFSIYGNGHG